MRIMQEYHNTPKDTIQETLYKANPRSKNYVAATHDFYGIGVYFYLLNYGFKTRQQLRDMTGCPQELDHVLTRLIDCGYVEEVNS